MESLVGKTLGQYQIIQELGRGGMAVVYKAYQPSLARNVAIKVLPPQFSFDHDFIERFVREARGAAMLHHPNIITIHDVAEQDGIHYFVMEYLSGKTLDTVLAETPMPLPRIAHIVNQVADALDHAHSQGLIHRDIKPSNIFVEEARNDHVKLVDFGLVRAGQDSKLTKTGMIVGTPEYMSPEQAQGEPVDHRTDVYSLGVVVYRMLTGTAPFVRSTPAAVLLAHVAYEPPSISQLAPKVPRPVEAVVLKAMAKDRNQRYSSASQFAHDLQIAITGQMPAGLQMPAPAPRAATAPMPAATLVAAPTTPPPAAQAVAPPVSVAPSVPAAPAVPKKAGGTSPLVFAGLGVAALAVLCVGAIVILGLLKPGQPATGGGTTTPQAIVASPTSSQTLLDAPSLKGPADGAAFSPNDSITLRWDPIAGLSADDSYAVTLDCASGASGPQTEKVKGTSYSVPSSLYSSLKAPYQCRWSVAVVSQADATRSASSSTWQFSWSQASTTVPPKPTATLAETSTPTLTPSPRPTVPTNTPRPRPTATQACTGGRIWNGTDCVCPPDKPNWLNGQCVPTGSGKEGGPQPQPTR